VTEDSRLLKIVHASLEVFDSDAQAMHDMRELVRLGAHILCGTESGDDKRQHGMKLLLSDAGYRSYIPTRTDGWIAVKRSLVHGDWTARYTQVINSAPAMNDPHPYSARGVVQVMFNHDSLGHITVVGGGHYLTKGRWRHQAQQDKPGDPVNHVAWNHKIAREMADACLAGARGTGISFFTADTNLVDRTTDVFFGKPLTTCWDELGKWPDTGHGNIDVVGSVDNDHRVKCENAKVLTDKSLELFTDHFVVSTQYRVHKINQREAQA
jgi:hypothetical protein